MDAYMKGGEEDGEEREEAPFLPESGDGTASRDGCVWSIPPLPFLVDLSRTFGSKLLTILFVAQHLVKGFALSMAGSAMVYVYRALKVNGPRQQIFASVTQLPWAMKPIFGLTSDNLPIFGYNKAPYIVLTSIIGTAAFVILGFIDLTSVMPEYVVLAFFVVNVQISTADLLTEAKYAARIREIPASGPDLLTYVWFGINLAGLCAILITGPLLAHVGTQSPFLVAAPFAALLIPFVLFNFLDETRQTPAQISDRRAETLRQPVLLGLSLLMFAGTVILSVVGLVYESPALNAATAATVGSVVLIAFSTFLSPMVAKVNAFFLIQTAMGLDISGASYYFFTDGKDEFEDGPHFSEVFYVTVLGVVSSLMSLVGLALYNRFMKTWSYRRLLLMANLISCALGFLDVILFARLNKKWGIPDKVFVIGSSVSQTMVYQWMWLPGVIFLSQLCPEGVEATMYALLAGCHNLGSTIAASCGALMLHHLGVQPNGDKGEGAQFDKLWQASLVSTCMTVGALVLLPILIPDVKQTDALLEPGSPAASDPTHNSLFRQLCESRGWSSRVCGPKMAVN